MTQMTKEEALKKIDELAEYVKELDDKLITEADIEAFNIFVSKYDIEMMLLPAYDCKYKLSGCYGDFSVTYQDCARTKSEMVEHLNSIGSVLQNRKMIYSARTRMVQLEDISAFNYFDGTNGTDSILPFVLIPDSENSFVLSCSNMQHSVSTISQTKDEMFKYLRSKKVLRPVGRMEISAK